MFHFPINGNVLFPEHPILYNKILANKKYNSYWWQYALLKFKKLNFGNKLSLNLYIIE